MRKDLRFPLRSFEFGRCGKSNSCLMYGAETQNTRFDAALLSEKSDIPGRKVFGTTRVLA